MTETVLPFELPATDDSGFVQKTYIDPQVEPLPTGQSPRTDVLQSDAPQGQMVSAQAPEEPFAASIVDQDQSNTNQEVVASPQATSIEAYDGSPELGQISSPANPDQSTQLKQQDGWVQVADKADASELAIPPRGNIDMGSFLDLNGKAPESPGTAPIEVKTRAPEDAPTVDTDLPHNENEFLEGPNDVIPAASPGSNGASPVDTNKTEFVQSTSQVSGELVPHGPTSIRHVEAPLLSDTTPATNIEESSNTPLALSNLPTSDPSPSADPATMNPDGDRQTEPADVTPSKPSEFQPKLTPDEIPEKEGQMIEAEVNKKEEQEKQRLKQQESRNKQEAEERKIQEKAEQERERIRIEEERAKKLNELKQKEREEEMKRIENDKAIAEAKKRKEDAEVQSRADKLAAKAQEAKKLAQERRKQQDRARKESIDQQKSNQKEAEKTSLGLDDSQFESSGQPQETMPSLKKEDEELEWQEREAAQQKQDEEQKRLQQALERQEAEKERKSKPEPKPTPPPTTSTDSSSPVNWEDRKNKSEPAQNTESATEVANSDETSEISSANPDGKVQLPIPNSENGSFFEQLPFYKDVEPYFLPFSIGLGSLLFLVVCCCLCRLCKRKQTGEFNFESSGPQDLDMLEVDSDPR